MCTAVDVQSSSNLSMSRVSLPMILDKIVLVPDKDVRYGVEAFSPAGRRSASYQSHFNHEINWQWFVAETTPPIKQSGTDQRPATPCKVRYSRFVAASHWPASVSRSGNQLGCESSVGRNSHVSHGQPLTGTGTFGLLINV
jgi:hypothetical protein